MVTLVRKTNISYLLRLYFIPKEKRIQTTLEININKLRDYKLNKILNQPHNMNNDLKTKVQTNTDINSFKILDKKSERKAAAQFLLADYLYDSNLTETTISDNEDIYEY